MRTDRFLVPSLCLALATVGGFAISRSVAKPAVAQAPAAPANIALVDLAKLMNSLDELTTRNTELAGRKEGLQKQLNDLRTQMTDIDTDLKDVIPLDKVKERTEKMAQRFEIEALYEARGKAYQRLIDLDNGEIIRDLYTKVSTTVDAFAKREGFDLVLLDDRAIQLPTSRATLKEYNQIIESKRILFASQGLDVTDRLTTIMNNEYKAGIGNR
jgi:Skp family chaperone for outer membrane proteins